MASYVSTVTIPLADPAPSAAKDSETSMPFELAQWLMSQLVSVRAMRTASTLYEPQLNERANLFTVPPSRIGTVLDTDAQPAKVRKLVRPIKRMTTRVALSYKYMTLETMMNTVDMGDGMHFFYTVNAGMLEPTFDWEGDMRTFKFANFLFPIHTKADTATIQRRMQYTPLSNQKIDAGIGLMQFVATQTGSERQVRDYSWDVVLYLSTRRKFKRTSFASGRPRARRTTGITIVENAE